MELSDEHRQRIDAIKGTMSCPFDFKCEKEGFSTYPKVGSIGTLFECFEVDAKTCGLSFPFGNTFFCKCSLNDFIQKVRLGPLAQSPSKKP